MTNSKKYVRRFTPVDAFEWTGQIDSSPEWFKNAVKEESLVWWNEYDNSITVDTHDCGAVSLNIGDYVIFEDEDSSRFFVLNAESFAINYKAVQITSNRKPRLRQ